MKRLAILLCFLSFNSLAQNREIDSLLKSLNNQRIDSNIYNTSLQIAKIYFDSAYDKALIYFNKALEVSERSSDRKKVAHIYHQIGSMYQRKGEFQTALTNLNNALQIHEFLDNKEGIGQLLNDIGLIYKTWGKYDKALANYFDALKLFDEIGDAVNGAMALNNIGQIYYYRNDYEKSIEYFKKYLDVNKKNKKPRAVAGAANNIASAYMELERYDDALDYYVRSMRIYDSLGIKLGVAVIKDNIGSLFLREKKYNDALLYNSEALKVFEEIGSQPRICNALQSVGLAYSKLNQPELAIKYLKRSLDIALNLKQQETQKDVYETLSDVYAQTNQFEKALSNYKLFIQIKDSLLNSEKDKSIETIQAEYEAQKKEKEFAEINQKLHTQKNLVLLGTGLFILFIFLTSLIIRENYRRKKISTAAEKQTQIHFSIIDRASKFLSAQQNEKVKLFSAFEMVWQLNSSKIETDSCIPFIKDSMLILSFVSKSNQSKNFEIIKISIFDFINSRNNFNDELSIKEQYSKYISESSIWQNFIEEEAFTNVDFWCLNNDNYLQRFFGTLSAFHVDNQNRIADIRINFDGWSKAEKGDRFYFYTINRLNEFRQNEQEAFQDTIRKTIDRTLNLPFNDQKEIFSNCIELIEAGNETQNDISLFAIML
jgi:tetratricopeptide (TPR) repeat protein